MYDNVIMCGMSYRLTDEEVADLVTLFGEHPFLAILEDGTPKNRSRRATRRKKTAAKHHRLEKIASHYPSKDSNKHNLKKRCRESKAWYTYDDLRKDTEHEELREAWNIVSYEERRKAFFKEVDKFFFTDTLLEGAYKYPSEQEWGSVYIEKLKFHLQHPDTCLLPEHDPRYRIITACEFHKDPNTDLVTKITLTSSWQGKGWFERQYDEELQDYMSEAFTFVPEDFIGLTEVQITEFIVNLSISIIGNELDDEFSDDDYGYDDSGCEYPSLSEVRVVTDDFGVEWDFSELDELLPF